MILNRRIILLVILVLYFDVHSQSFFHSQFHPVLIHAESPEDIKSFNIDSSEFYVYSKIPDLSKLHPNDRKKKFIDLILPAILIEKSKIKTAYNYVLDHFSDISKNKFTQPLYDYCNCTNSYELLLCLSDQPNSVIIAQAAIESGWGTSRFFKEGFNLFGIHAYQSYKSKIKANGAKEHNIYVKKYNSISSSIFDYLRTLAKGYAYEKFRMMRLRQEDTKDMIKYLDHYSERREMYINDIISIIEYNNLMQYDTLDVYMK